MLSRLPQCSPTPSYEPAAGPGPRVPILTSDDGKKNPVVIVGQADIVGVELLIDVPNEIVQFYALTSSSKGCGRRIV